MDRTEVEAVRDEIESVLGVSASHEQVRAILAAVELSVAKANAELDRAWRAWEDMQSRAARAEAALSEKTEKATKENGEQA